jgi:hypothetical protein
VKPSQLVAALIAGATSALSLGLLPHPWAECVSVAIATIGALYIDRGTLTRCPDCGTVHELMAPPARPEPPD